MKNKFIFLILSICFSFSFVQAQDFDLMKSIQESGDSSYWKNASLLDRYNNWDILDKNIFGFTLPITNKDPQLWQLGILLIGPRGLAFNLSERDIIPNEIQNTPSGSISTFRADEIVADRAGLNFQPSEFLSSTTFYSSFDCHVLVNNLNSRILAPRKINYRRDSIRKDTFFGNTQFSSAQRKRSFGKNFSISVGVKYRVSTAYNLYSDNGLSADHLTSEGLLLADYSRKSKLSPLIGIVFHPKYFVVHGFYDFALNTFNFRGGISIMRNKRKRK